MANALLLGVGVALLLLQGLAAWLVPSEYVAPTLVLPMVLYMAVGDFSLARGVSLVFVLGYLADVFAGSSMGLWTFTLVSVFLLVRVAGLKLFLHGVFFQVMLTLVASVLAGLEMMALLLVFDRRPLAVLPAIGLVASQGLATAACAPAVFGMLRRMSPTLAGAPAEEA